MAETVSQTEGPDVRHRGYTGLHACVHNPQQSQQ